ncbi:MAG: hypothetical protein KKD63_06365, partial [Proteobacteria bacterium]|nr:hypothetical protein [Pseudomonadota bacterium]
HASDVTALGFPTTFQVTSGPATYMVTPSVYGTGGSISCAPTAVPQGQTSICTIIPADGYQISGLTDNGGSATSSGGSYTISAISTDHAVVATFGPIPDTTAPTVSIILPTTSGTLTVSITISAHDNVGVTGYCISEPSSGADCSWLSSAPANYSFATAGSKTLFAFARDSAGNISSGASGNVTIDASLPSLMVSTLPDGAVTNNPTLNISGTATDLNGLQGLVINNQQVAVDSNNAFSTAITLEPGANFIIITVTSIASTKTTDTRTVTLDQNAPLLDVATPADNSITNHSSISLSGTVSENASVIVTIEGNSETEVVTVDGNAFDAMIDLVPGVNTITVTATDLAGNVGQAKRTVTYDAIAPVLEITDPVQDIRATSSTYLLKGSVTDAITPVTLSVSFEGQIYQPAVTNGMFELPLSFTEKKQYAISVVATDEAGNAQTVQRNIIYATGFDYSIYNGNATLSCNAPTIISKSEMCGQVNDSYSCELSISLSSTELLATCKIIPAIESSFTNAAGCSGSYYGNDYVTGDLTSPCTISGELAGSITTTTTSTTSTSSSTTTTTIPDGQSITLQAGTGWSLLSSTIGFQVQPVLGNNAKYTSVWKWENGKWAVFLPGENSSGNYATSKGFSQLTAINSGEGFWVNSTSLQNVLISGTPVYGPLAFTSGWNLLGLKSATASTVTEIITSQSGIISIWKWKGGAWAVYLTSEGSTSGAYAASKGFSVLSTITPGEGFWVNAVK